MFKVGDEVWIHLLDSNSLVSDKRFSVVTWVHNKKVHVRGLETRFCLQTGVRKHNPYCKVAKHEQGVFRISKVTQEESKQYKKKYMKELIRIKIDRILCVWFIIDFNYQVNRKIQLK